MLELRSDTLASNASMFGLIAAAPAGLLYYNVFGDVGADPGRSLAPGRPQAAVSGSPVANGQWTTMMPGGAEGSIDTLVTDRDAVTIMAVAGLAPGQPGDNRFSYAVGSYVSGTATGANIAAFPAAAGTHKYTGFVGRRDASNNPSSEQVGAFDPFSFRILCLRTSSTYGTRTDDFTAGTFAENRTAPIRARTLSTGTYRIGRAPLVQADLYGETNVVAAAIWEGVLTDAQAQACAVQMRGLLSDRVLV